MKNLISITPENGFDVELDIIYATSNNFTGEKIYDETIALLHPKAAKLFLKAIEIAKKHNFRFKVWDTFRSIKYQEFLFEKFPDGNYISNPKTGLVTHCRGVAIDLTLIDENGEDLKMGTAFDDFRLKAHHGAEGLTVEEERNRFLLMGIMQSAGFDIYRFEWWHYQLYDVKDYPVI
ncbi:MAG: D-alanyl-D-alanine dipeptidase [Lentimonas sp.]|jgi:D-alanyl-D-alanine dipeptidase